MGRRRKGRDVSGWLVIDKPVGVTSNDVVGKARWAFGARKAGHAGTLDPAATGVLAIAFGEATKTVPYVTDALKGYHFTVNFGASTNTDDAEGEVIARSDRRPTDSEIIDVLPQFTGDIMQVPPQFSAVKIDGQRAYKLARDGETAEIQPRALFVDTLRLLSRDAPDRATFEMVCGKGGYVRAIARDIGTALGCLGHVKSLRRTWSGPFKASEGLSFDALEALADDPDRDDRLLPMEIGLGDLPRLTCSAEGAVRLRHGNPGMVVSSEAGYGDVAWACYQGRPVAVGIYRSGELHPTRVFNLPE